MHKTIIVRRALSLALILILIAGCLPATPQPTASVPPALPTTLSSTPTQPPEFTGTPTTPQATSTLPPTLTPTAPSSTPTLPPLPITPEPWAPQTPQLSTQWTEQVTPENVLPEYPRPQMVREDWQNLNGVWEFAVAGKGDAPPFGRPLPQSILVPFPVESALSGLMRRQIQWMWYRRTFSIPEEWSGRHVLLHFGAVDWQATVYVNGSQVGSHAGGYDAFSFDITGLLEPGDNELIVGVYDPTVDGGQPIGKQRNYPREIWYTACTGIWQTVWLEPVPETSIARLDMTPDLDEGGLKLTVQGLGIQGETIEAVAFDGGREAGRAEGAPGTEITIPVPDAKLWSPDQPFLYDLTVTLKDGDLVVDQVTSYFGMRSIEIARVGDTMRPLLNGKFVFQMGLLDQGYWPDGIYTAPTDEALRYDIEQAKAYGYNLLRKHVKVEPQRWYYWADKLGILVWQDMPNMVDTNENPSPAARQQFELELKEVIDEHRSSPAIVMWVPFNEGWGEYEPERITRMIAEQDPSRLVNNASGWWDANVGDVRDIHDYPGPSSPPPEEARASVLGEFGGLGLRVAEHEWASSQSFSYERQRTAEDLNERYLQMIGRLQVMVNSQGLSAAVYTQLTDVEGEVNGVLTYDRAVTKLDLDRVKAAHAELIQGSQE